MVWHRLRRKGLSIGACWLVWQGLAVEVAGIRGVSGGREGVVGQEPKKAAAPAIVAQVDLVNVEVSVLNPKGDFVAGLKRENFRILDNGAEQPITHFAPTEEPAEILVLVETSPAVYLIHRQHLLAAEALLGNLAVHDRVAVATYDQSIRFRTNFTEDKSALANVLSELRYSLGSGQLNLYDSLAAAIDGLGSGEKKKGIVLLSTGLDTSGENSWQKLKTRLMVGQVVVFPVALGGELRVRAKGKSKTGNPREEQSVPPELSFAHAEQGLREIAEMTGGRLFIPRDGSEFTAIYQQIARRLRNQYSLGFAPPARDGQIHRLEVQVLGDVPACRDPKKQNRIKEADTVVKGCRVESRQEYLAPAE